MKIPFTDLYSQYKECKSDIDNSIQDIIKRSDYLTGITVKKFEDLISKYTGAEDCASTGSGTDALVCALKALGVDEADTVWTVGHTYISTTEAIATVGAKPIFIDIDQYYHLDLEKIKDFNPDCPPAVILFVDLYGQTPDIDKLKKFAKKYQIKLLEDAAQSFGSKYKGKKVGSLVDLTCFSFNPVKNLGAMGDAGAVTGSKKLIKKVRMFRDHGRKSQFEYEKIGTNARIDNLQAVVVQAKLKKLDQWIKIKRQICHRYSRLLKNYVKVPKEAPWSYHTYYVYVIETPKGSRDKLKEFLKKKGIDTNIHYRIPTHKTNAYKEHSVENLKITENVCKNVLSLPCYHTLTKSKQDYIIKCVKDFYTK